MNSNLPGSLAWYECPPDRVIGWCSTKMNINAGKNQARLPTYETQKNTSATEHQSLMVMI
ncbi:hypothetical protein DUNSADRAFT_3305 [Dunaliella salina]|uniref:Uncharacterized protein n=1 Tax=Dunaliella salina TaxID=3046 RepID=A0ABQ7GU81_DUNSA|nr:hypothetical protein DUNSADRAFT_3305 [Dunaliella salina]|eukprot:KAF5838180.1 hypothetical protein DUNSADRAFT_3305 [Dunaliella salina]